MSTESDENQIEGVKQNTGTYLDISKEGIFFLILLKHTFWIYLWGKQSWWS